MFNSRENKKKLNNKAKSNQSPLFGFPTNRRSTGITKKTQNTELIKSLLKDNKLPVTGLKTKQKPVETTQEN